ncbi:hypothetical protein Q3G72_030719 [Acer saccharum]|nr:hypothetical protein Q3G72_030719 [Acer saccharum]
MRLAELEEDYHCKQGCPCLQVRSEILSHVAWVYTNKMFSFFEKEYRQIVSTTLTSTWPWILIGNQEKSVSAVFDDMRSQNSQLEPSNSEAAKKKPPDHAVSAKSSRVYDDDASDMPRKPVSYDMNNKRYMSSNYNASKNGSVGGAGKNGNSYRNDTSIPITGIEKHVKPGSGTSSGNRTPNYGDGKSMPGGRKNTSKVGEKVAEKRRNVNERWQIGFQES